jgi:adenylosuccinate synthase
VKVSSRAHLILPYQSRARITSSEERLGNEKVGTTLRGIGPAYEDKGGGGLCESRMALVPEVLRSRIERNLEDANRHSLKPTAANPWKPTRSSSRRLCSFERLAPFVADTSHFLNQAAACASHDFA